MPQFPFEYKLKQPNGYSLPSADPSEYIMGQSADTSSGSAITCVKCGENNSMSSQFCRKCYSPLNMGGPFGSLHAGYQIGYFRSFI